MCIPGNLTRHSKRRTSQMSPYMLCENFPVTEISKVQQMCVWSIKHSLSGNQWWYKLKGALSWHVCFSKYLYSPFWSIFSYNSLLYYSSVSPSLWINVQLGVPFHLSKGCVVIQSGIVSTDWTVSHYAWTHPQLVTIRCQFIYTYPGGITGT